MRVVLKPGLLALSPDTDAERSDLATWRKAVEGHVFVVSEGSGALIDIGEKAEACREPINIVFDQLEARWQPISNLAHTPFSAWGRTYASVEGFWQGLKFPAQTDRDRVAKLWGGEAKRATAKRVTDTFVFDEEVYPLGGPRHRSLMAQACQAKFSQNLAAKEALQATGHRPLTHRVRRDSATIPGALMADIWMRIREQLRA